MKYFTVLVFVVAATAIAQSPPAIPVSPQLFETVAQLDAKMFGAFNAHDIDLLMSMFTDDMEFYHDKGGLTKREQTREGFAKMFSNSPDIRRELIPGSRSIRSKILARLRLERTVFAIKKMAKRTAAIFRSSWSGEKSASRGRSHASLAAVTSEPGPFFVGAAELPPAMEFDC
jgi:hypothetical protein